MGTLKVSILAFLVTCTFLVGCAESAPGEQTSNPDFGTIGKQINVEMTQGTNMSAALSPNGTALVIALQGTLWTLPAEGGVATSITPAELDAHEPVWSPDGKSIAFYAFAEDGFTIWSVNEDGSELKLLIDMDGDARYPSFSPDGTKVIFSSDEKADGYQAWSFDLLTSERSVITTSNESGYKTPLAPFFSGSGNVVYPMISPDGLSIAFVLDGEMDALVTRDLSEPNETRVIHAAKILGAPAWSSDGDALYIVGLNDAEGHLARVDIGDNKPIKIVEGGDIFPFRPSVSDDDTVTYTSDGNINTISPDGEPRPAITFSATVQLDRSPYKRRVYDLADKSPRDALGIVDPVLSPDGASAVFTALGDLWIADLPDGKPVRLTDDAFVDLSPSWSPDGAHLAFVSDRGGKADIWSLELSTNEFTRVTDSVKPVSAPNWAPDGTEIAYLSDVILSVFVGSTVNTVNLKDGKVDVISAPLFGPSAPEWSPDGSRIAVVARQPFTNRFREGHNAIFMLSTSESVDPLWVHPLDGTSLGRRQWNRLAWASDGTIVYRMNGGLWSAKLSSAGDLSDVVQITESGENPAWSEDSTALIFIDGEKLKIFDRRSREISIVNIKPVWSQKMPESEMTLRAGRLFDGNGDTYQVDVDIVVRSGVIEAIHPANSQPVVGELIDASDKTIIPGLIDSHTHQSTNLGLALGQTWLDYGVTTVRETGDDPYHAVERREAAASGRRPGPRVFTAGPLNEGARVSYGVSETVGTEERARDAMRLSADLELDMVKSYVRQNYKVQKTIIAEAHAIGVPVSSHELYPSVAFGIDNMEHFGATSRRGYSLKLSRAGNSYQDVVSLIAKSGVVVTPTLALSSRNGTVGITGQENMLRSVVGAGGKIVAGTDSPFVPFGDSLHTELEIYVDAGLTPAQALRSATSEAADALGVGKQLGRIVPGALADFVILDGDPLIDITQTRAITIVIQNGVVRSKHAIMSD